ncbi:MAG: sigma 54-interacting transcriptional regulator [Polyangiaceae bacterium]|nr:sigma 54-interacting transcriptional regulator [Polyangiaceae bacterium]
MARYTLHERLGAGSTAEVFRAVDSRGVSLALKIAPADRAPRLATEAERLLHVDSPWLPAVLDAGTVRDAVEGAPSGLDPSAVFVAMRHCPGAPLDPTRAGGAQRRRELALVVARDAARALADLHAAGHAHGDVKPSNVVVAPDGRSATLVDLDLAAGLDQPTPSGGTPRYLAPEVFSGAPGDARARDLWALGAVVAETALGERVEPGELRRRLDAPLATLVASLLARAPSARPGAGWVAREAARLAGSDPELEAVDDRRRAIRRAYLRARGAWLARAATARKVRFEPTGLAARWLEDAARLARAVAVLRGAAGRDGALIVPRLSPAERDRWLVDLVGPPASRWALPALDESALAELLIERVTHVAPRSLRLADLLGAPAELPDPPSSPVELALALGRGAPTEPLLVAVERAVARGGQPALALALALAHRQRGALGVALAVLADISGDEARAEAAETARRARDAQAARAELALVGAHASRAARARAAATTARLALEARDPLAGLAELAGAPATAAVAEARALAELALGRLDAAAASAADCRALALTEEERARADGVLGNVTHARGDFEGARAAFSRAADHAAHAGATLEEATYLTGAAAAAATLGELAEALDEARRAAVLFEHVGRRGEAARAWLAAAAVHATLAAAEETRECAGAALAHARASGDRACAAYAHLALADVLPPGDREAIDHVERASALVEGDLPRLRVAARQLLHGVATEVDAYDALAAAPSAPAEARLEWWGARALACERAGSASADAERVLAAVSALVSAQVPPAARGPALAAAARLAAQRGDGEVARRLTEAARLAGRELLGGLPPELAVRAAALPWLATEGDEALLSPEQISRLGALVTSLGEREATRVLLQNVVDALVLWTGVERGVLLLRAPGERLVPRVARNLARRDLIGEQLALSRTLAARALAERAPVVAVDAARDLPEVHESVHALALRSVLAVPLVARGEALGVVYLDDRIRTGAFGPRELAWVRAVAALAALAIADARDQVVLRRALRKTRRAERRAMEELAVRDVELDVASRELARARGARPTRARFAAIVGESEALVGMLRLVERVAASEVPVLVTGESGTGKELVARAIHEHGARAARPFVAESCAAIPETLLETTLFGHVRGAFTGAVRPRGGLFEAADGGTLFLDEIGEMSLPMQAKLLRVLQAGEITPVGSDRARRVDVRVLAATHRDLGELVRARRFREDLYYRLDVVRVRVPPLRERDGDIPLLVRHFLAMYAAERRVEISRAALQALAAHAWPGNVRQLENELRRALVLADDAIDLAHLSPTLVGPAPSAEAELDLRARVDRLERELVRRALERTAGNQTRAAVLLGLSRFGLQKMMRRLDVQAAAR